MTPVTISERAESIVALHQEMVVLSSAANVLNVQMECAHHRYTEEVKRISSEHKEVLEKMSALQDAMAKILADNPGSFYTVKPRG